MANTMLDLDRDGHIAIPLRIVTGPRAVGVQIRTLLQSIREHWPEDQTLGIPWPDLQPESVPEVVLEGYVRDQLGRIPEITIIEEITVTRSAGDLTVAVVCVVATDGTPDTVIRVISGPIYDSDPGSWYTLITRSPRGLLS